MRTIVLLLICTALLCSCGHSVSQPHLTPDTSNLQGQILYFPSPTSLPVRKTRCMVKTTICTVLLLLCIACTSFSPAPPGKIAFESGVNIDVVNTDGSDLDLLIANAQQPVWSPPGTEITFVRSSGSIHEADFIFIADSDGKNERLLTRGQHPAWSPDGTKLAFEFYQDPYQGSDIWIINADGTNLLAVTTDGIYNESPAWSPDGIQLVFVHGRDLYTINTDGSEMSKLAEADECGFISTLDWSPGGQQILFGCSSAICVIQDDGTGWTVLGDGLTPRWSLDGSTIIFAGAVGWQGDYSELHVMNHDGTGARLLATELRYRGATYPSWSR